MGATMWTAGIIGCGRIAGATDHPRAEGAVRTHAQGYTRHPHFRLVAAVDPGTASLEAFQRAWDIPRGYRSVGELMANERVDVISLCSPTDDHAAQAVEILTAPNRPSVLFMEKPVCVTPQELGRLMELAQGTNTAVLVNHTRRFDLPHRRAAQMIQQGTFGTLMQGRCVYYGGWLNNGTHIVDTARMLFAEEIRLLAAAWAPGGRGADHNVTVQGLIGDGEIRIEGIEETHYKLLECDFRLTAGRLQVLNAGGDILLHRVGLDDLGERILVPAEGSPMEGLATPLAEAMAVIEECLDGRPRLGALEVDLAAAARTMHTVWQARELAAGREQAGVVSDHADPRA